MTGEHVVILVDEYDKPLLSTQYINEELNEKYRTILKGFYGVLKIFGLPECGSKVCVFK